MGWLREDLKHMVTAATDVDDEDTVLLAHLRRVITRECVRVGLAAIVVRPRVGILAAIRRCDPGKGKLSFPGGHLREGETWEQGMRREVEEETGLLVDPTPWSYGLGHKAYLVTNNRHASGLHHVTIWMICVSEFGDPVDREPNVHDHWSWHKTNQFSAFDGESEDTCWIPYREMVRIGQIYGVGE